MTTLSRKVFSPRLLACLVVTFMLFTLAAGMPASAANCPSINAIGNFQPDPFLIAGFTPDANNGTDTYTFTSTDESPIGGIPGLISYCVYPNQPPGNPTSAAVDPSATGDNGQLFKTSFGSIQGFFAFTRADGDPSNIGLDGTTRTMGTATWPDIPGCDPLLGPCGTAPSVQTIVLHINDPDECAALYPDSNPLTCFVIPTGGGTPPPPTCNGNPACKSVIIDEADVNDPLTVPGNTLLHIHYTYVIQNQPTNTFDMIFKNPWSKTDINNGGGKDYFGCEQQPDPNGTPGAWGDYPGYVTGWDLKLVAGTGKGCPQSRFFFRPFPTTVTLSPGQSVTFNIDMITRTNKGGNQEYTSCGLHLLNSGFTVKWFQSDTGNLLHNFSTNITPIYVNVVSGGKLVCP